MSRPLVLWDIDGTLLSTGGAGRRAMASAFAAVHGVEDAFDGLSFAGRTDDSVVGEACRRAGLNGPQDHARLKQAYSAALRAGLSRRPPEVLPGVREVLAREAPGALMSLLTGNWPEGAWVKLHAAGLAEGFTSGAFGDDAHDRDALVPVAVARARASGWEGGPVVVIGDTLHDVSCARAGGAVAVAVCTGWGAKEALRAAGPDLLLEDLACGAEALAALLSDLRGGAPTGPPRRSPGPLR